jgi:hypothetical protein
MNKDGRITDRSLSEIEFEKYLAVQNERGPRQPFPDRHMHITGSFPIKPEVKQILSLDIHIYIHNLAIVCSSGNSNSFIWKSISIITLI